MNSTLITALIGLVGVMLGSSTAFAALSPASRRLKRLSQLIELRPSVEDAETRLRVDYATERLAHQIAEDSVASGDRISSRGLFLRWIVLIGGLGIAVASVLRVGESSGDWFDWTRMMVGLAMATFAYFSLAIQFLRSPRKLAAEVDSALDQRRDHQGSQPARAEGSPEGDVPAP